MYRIPHTQTPGMHRIPHGHGHGIFIQQDILKEHEPQTQTPGMHRISQTQTPGMHRIPQTQTPGRTTIFWF